MKTCLVGVLENCFGKQFFKACLFTLSENCFVLKNKENKENSESTFGFHFFFVLKNIKNKENTKFKGQERFLKNTKMSFLVFSKTILKNNFKKQEPNMSLNFQDQILFGNRILKKKVSFFLFLKQCWLSYIVYNIVLIQVVN